MITSLKSNNFKIFKSIIADQVLALEEIYYKNKKKISYKTHFKKFEEISQE